MYPGRTIKQLRLLKGFSQKGIAQQLGISQPAYSKLEKRETINGKQLKKILAIMDSSEDELKTVEQFKLRL